jgi:tetratricopeptide (TPR) repeat protein
MVRNQGLDRHVKVLTTMFSMWFAAVLSFAIVTSVDAESLISQAATQGRTVARDSAQVNYLKAAKFAQEGRYGPAIMAMERAIEYLPNEPQLRVDLAVLQAASGNEIGAIGLLEVLTQAPSPYPPALMELGELHLALGDTALATTTYRRLTTGDEPYPPAFVRLGDMRHSVGERAQALRFYRSAIQADSAYIEAWMRLGSVLVVMDRFSQAMRTFDAALEIDPENAGINQFRNMAALKKVEYEEGIAQGKMRARIILVETEELSAAVTRRLENGADFISLAVEVSIHPSADIGGDLGFFSYGDLIPAIEEAAAALQPDEFSPVIRIGSGFAVILRVN